MVNEIESGAHQHPEFVTHQELTDAISEAKLEPTVVDLDVFIPDPIIPEPLEPVDPTFPIDDGFHGLSTNWDFKRQRIDNVNYKNILSLFQFGHGNRYLRQHNHLVLTGQTFLHIFRASDGAKLSLTGKFDIYFNNKRILTTDDLNTIEGSWGFKLSFDSTQLPDGRYWVKIVPQDDDANGNPTSIPFPVYIKNTDTPVDNLRIPVWRGTYDIIKGSKPLWWGACEIPGNLPARTTPLSRPMPSLPKALRVEDGQVIRESEIPKVILTRDNASQTILVPRRSNDTHRFGLDEHGILHTAAIQGYYLDWINDRPRMPLLDGPRGVGTISAMTSIEIDSTGGIFGTDGFRIVRVWPDGRVQTRAGYRHIKGVSDEPELVGDWSEVKGPKGFLELWGFTWDTRTLNTNNDLQWVSISNTNPTAIPPHDGPVVLFCADTRNNRICKVEFHSDGANTVMGVHDIEPKITEWITGLSNPWKVRYHEERLYITERTANRITVYSADKPETYISNLIKGPRTKLFNLDSRQQVRRLISLSEARKFACFAPEGMEIFDGELYFGSYGTLEIKKINLSTRKISVVWNMGNILGGNDRFVNFEIAKDGTVTERGNLLVTTWGRCVFFNPETGAHFSPPYHSHGEPNVDGSGITRYWFTSYPSAAAVGFGRFAVSMPFEGINIVHARIPTDTRTDRARYELGKRKYEDAEFKLMYQEGGNSNHNLPLPWGVDPDIDFYLEKNNHKK